jgi:hypothetical protein
MSNKGKQTNKGKQAAQESNAITSTDLIEKWSVSGNIGSRPIAVNEVDLDNFCPVRQISKRGYEKLL